MYIRLVKIPVTQYESFSTASDRHFKI